MHLLPADPKNPAPDSLGVAGQRVWNAVTARHDGECCEPLKCRPGVRKYHLRPDDYFHLEQWAKAVDRIADIEENLARSRERWGEEGADLLMPGLQGTKVSNPLLAELRQWNTQASAAAKALKLPDLAPAKPAAKSGGLAGHQSAAAKARWGKQSDQTG